MCSWHFLMIFSAVFNLSPWVGEGRVVWMQITLYIALAAAYGVIALTSKRFIKAVFRSGPTRWGLANLAIALLAAVSSILVILSYNTPLPWQVFTYVLLGCSGALLIYPWLQLPQIKDETINYQNLAFNMGVGSLFAFGISFLQSPVVYIAICALPLLSTLLLIRRWDGTKELAESTERPLNSTHRTTFSEAFSAHLHFLMYGLAFGYVQGIFANDIQINFALNSGWPLLGATLSALVIFFMPQKHLKAHGIFALQRMSMVIMYIGLFVAVFFTLPNPDLPEGAAAAGSFTGQALTFGGFNIFEFGFMLFSFTWAARLKTDFATHIGYNRVLLYAGMAIGLGLGFLLSWTCSSMAGYFVLSQGIVVVFLAVLTLPPFYDFAPYGKVESPEEQLDVAPHAGPEEPAASDAAEEEEIAEAEEEEEEKEEKGKEEGEHLPHWKIRVDSIAEAHGLSEREKEVFVYLAKGRNAAYIQQELWISIHTVKTHIANIYRKLDVHSLQEVIDMVENVPREEAEEAPNGKETE